jgi:N-acetylmuramoyl-L-alanine amidase
MCYGHFDIALLALMLWREARGEPYLVRVAVACSVMNRVRAHSWFGDTIGEVVTKKWQYSAFTAPGDPNLVLWPKPKDPVFEECLRIAGEVAANPNCADPTGGATHYFDLRLADNPPPWAKSAQFKVRLGRLFFYRAA